MWPLAASKAGIPVWIFYLLIFEDRLKRKNLQLYIQITLYFGILPKPYLQHLPQKQHQSNLVFLYICNFGLVFNAETQLNVSIYTVEICKVAGTALTVHAVIHNDMHKTQHYPIGSKHTHIYIYIKPTDRIFQQTNDTSDIHFLMKQFLCGFIDKIWSSTRSPKFTNWNVKKSFFVGYNNQ